MHNDGIYSQDNTTSSKVKKNKKCSDESKYSQSIYCTFNDDVNEKHDILSVTNLRVLSQITASANQSGHGKHRRKTCDNHDQVSNDVRQRKHFTSSVYVQLTSCDRLNEQPSHGVEELTQFKQSCIKPTRSITQLFVGTNVVHSKRKFETQHNFNSPSIYVRSHPDLIMSEPEEEHATDVKLGQDSSSEMHKHSASMEGIGTCTDSMSEMSKHSASMEGIGTCTDSMHRETKVSKFNVVLSQGDKDSISENKIPFKRRIIRTMSKSNILKENTVRQDLELPSVSSHSHKPSPLDPMHSLPLRHNLLTKSESLLAYMNRSKCYLSPHSAHECLHNFDKHRHKSEPSVDVSSQPMYRSSLSIDFKSHDKPIELCGEPSHSESHPLCVESTSSNDHPNSHNKLSKSKNVLERSPVDEIFQQENSPVYKYNLDRWLQTVLKVNESNPNDSFNSLHRTSSVSGDWLHTMISPPGESSSNLNRSEDINLLSEDFICDFNPNNIPLHSSPIVSLNVSPKHHRTLHNEKHISEDSQQNHEISSQTELGLRPPKYFRQVSSPDNCDDTVSKDHPISIYVTDDDSMFSDSFFTPRSSIQLCEDDMLMKHHSISPRSSFGSLHSTRSSNADSAVDVHNPDDEVTDITLTDISISSHLTRDLTQEFYNVSKNNRQDSKNLTLPPFVITDHSDSIISAIPSDSSSTELNINFLMTQESDDSYLSDISMDDIDENIQSSPRQEEKASTECEYPDDDAAVMDYLTVDACTGDTDEDLSDWDAPVEVDLAEPPAPRTVNNNYQSSWKKIKGIIKWSPFVQVFKKNKYPWIQLAGHQGNFQAGECGSVLKKLDKKEKQCYVKLMLDKLQPVVPEYRGDEEKNGEKYLQLQDLLCDFEVPCVMDVKMGCRSFLEDELEKAMIKPTLRKDMYQKMIEVEPGAPTDEENTQKAVTKPRYMQWRDDISSSVNLGFRVEGVKKSDGTSSKDFKKAKTEDQVKEILKSFIGENTSVLPMYIERLKEVRSVQESSEFFQRHEIIGSSLLFVHDENHAGAWMIDFGKTVPLPEQTEVNHRSCWTVGNHEDGYLFGIDKLISILESMQNIT